MYYSSNNASPTSENTQPSIYPFYIKFSSAKEKKFHILDSNTQQDNQPSVTKAQCSDYENQSFESYEDSEELQILSSSRSQASLEAINQSSEFNKVIPLNKSLAQNSMNIKYDSTYFNLSTKFLQKMNERMVSLKQIYRQLTARYKVNASILRQQRQELDKLRNLKRKALDFDYELQVSREFARGKAHSIKTEENITKQFTLIRKHKYKQMKEDLSLRDPQDACCVLSGSRILDHRSGQLFRLGAKREEVLCQRRQQERNENYLCLLVRKEEEYRLLIETYDSLGKEDSLTKRSDFLRREIEIKKSLNLSKQMGINIEIQVIRSQIAEADIKLQMFSLKLQSIKAIIGRKNASEMIKKIKPISSYFKLKKTQIQPIKIQLTPQSTNKKQFKLLRLPANKSRTRQHTTHQ